MDSQHHERVWYFKSEGKTMGPVSIVSLQDFLAAGQIAHQQAVWCRLQYDTFFVTAATAVAQATGKDTDRPAGEGRGIAATMQPEKRAMAEQ